MISNGAGDGYDFLEALTIIKSTPNMNLIALQVHFAKRDPKYWSKRAQGIIDIYRKIEEKYELHPECIDLGGGMSGKIPGTLRSQLKLDDIKYDDYASRAATLFAEAFKNDKNAPWLFIEPGTAIAATTLWLFSVNGFSAKSLYNSTLEKPASSAKFSISEGFKR